MRGKCKNPTTHNISMQVALTEAQYEVAMDTHRFRILDAGRRFGKSTLARLLCYKWALEKPGVYWIVSPTYTQSVQNHWLEMCKEISPEWVAKKYEAKSFTFKNGSVIELKGADNPDSLRGIKLRGLIIDEIASIRDWDWLWYEVLRATLADYQAPAIFISTPKGYNHFYHLFNLGQQPGSDYKSWRFTSYDNPHIAKSEIDAARKDLDEDVFAQEYLADYRKYTGHVYKDFDRLKHVKSWDDFTPVYYLRGLDRGYTNPTATPIIGVNKDGVWYQTHELYKRGLTTTMLVDELRNLDMIAGVPVYEYETMDSASAGDIAELNDFGFPFIPVEKVARESNINYVRFKIQKFADRIRNNRYFVHPRNTETIREFEAYSYPEKKNELENDSEQPEKLNDHMMDALADLNAMYAHYYEQKEKKPWDDKIKGTYIEPSIPDEDDNMIDFVEADSPFGLEEVI